MWQKSSGPLPRAKFHVAAHRRPSPSAQAQNGFWRLFRPLPDFGPDWTRFQVFAPANLCPLFAYVVLDMEPTPNFTPASRSAVFPMVATWRVTEPHMNLVGNLSKSPRPPKSERASHRLDPGTHGDNKFPLQLLNSTCLKGVTVVNSTLPTMTLPPSQCSKEQSACHNDGCPLTSHVAPSAAQLYTDRGCVSGE